MGLLRATVGLLHATVLLLIAPAASLQNAVTNTSVAFIGNSFTFYHDMPGLFNKLATSLNRPVITDSSTIGGCTVYAQLNNSATTKMLNQREWDYVVVQDHSTMATVKNAMDVYFKPAIQQTVDRFADKRTKTVLYETWGYHHGSDSSCPSGSSSGCFPKGSMKYHTNPSCSKNSYWKDTTSTHDCMQYFIARGYWDAFKSLGVDVFVPAGIAFQLAGYSKGLNKDCVSKIDAELENSTPLPFTLPLQDVDAGDAANIELFIYKGYPYYKWDKHPTVKGSYLVACVFYATLFGESPEGGWRPSGVTDAEARTLQQLAAAVVLPRRDLFVGA